MTRPPTSAETTRESTGLVLPWAARLAPATLEAFLADLAEAASGGDGVHTLAAVEAVLAGWRLGTEDRATDEAVDALAAAIQAAEAEGEPAGTPAALIASQLVGMDDALSVTVDDDHTVTVHIRPRDLDGWQWWLGRFQVPVESVTHRGSVTTARGTAPGGVTVCLVGHGITTLQAAAIPYITEAGEGRG